MVTWGCPIFRNPQAIQVIFENHFNGDTPFSDTPKFIAHWLNLADHRYMVYGVKIKDLKKKKHLIGGQSLVLTSPIIGVPNDLTHTHMGLPSMRLPPIAGWFLLENPSILMDEKNMGNHIYRWIFRQKPSIYRWIFPSEWKKWYLETSKWVCLKMLCTPLYPMVLLIIIPFLNGYFIGNINPTFSDTPKWQLKIAINSGFSH